MICSSPMKNKKSLRKEAFFIRLFAFTSFFAYIADSYFPNLDEDPQWHVAAESEEQTYFDLEFYFYKYERVQK